jgi:hypothetical protein
VVLQQRIGMEHQALSYLIKIASFSLLTKILNASLSTKALAYKFIQVMGLALGDMGEVEIYGFLAK